MNGEPVVAADGLAALALPAAVLCGLLILGIGLSAALFRWE